VADYDLVVVGLGALGSSAAYQAAVRGIGSIAGFEQFEFGHSNGASEDHSRIIRRCYHHPAESSRDAYRAASLSGSERA